MAVLERSELEASPLADLHAIANEVGIDGFRRLRKADLISAILGEPPAEPKDEAGEPAKSAPPRTRAPRPALTPLRHGRGGRARRRPRSPPGRPASATATPPRAAQPPRAPAAHRARGGRPRAGARRPAEEGDAAGRIAEGVVEVLGNGSAFLRVDPPEASDEDVYISAAQVRRCELVSGDRVTGPVRTAPALRALPLTGPDRHHQRRAPPMPSPTARATRTFRSHGRASGSRSAPSTRRWRRSSGSRRSAAARAR